MISGYMNTILRVDLTKGEVKETSFPEDWKISYLGGTGVAARIIYDEVPPDADAFDPRNVVCIFTGPYTGTGAPTSGRYGVAAKSPLTRGWGEATASGFWAPELKFAGFDGIVVTGKSEKPVYLLIDDGRAELKPADDLWGKTTGVTDEILREKHGEKVKVLSIGPAGEKLVRFACVISDKGRAAGRCGIGAVLGSKKLKAIAVRGTQRVSVADPDKFSALRREYTRTIKDSIGALTMSVGTAGVLATSASIGDFPVKNWQLASLEGAERLGPGNDLDKILVKPWACYSCPIGCGRTVRVDKEVAGVEPFESHAPEYETMGTFGGALLISDIETVATANHICNEYGMDTISAGGIVAFAFEAFDRGILNVGDIGFELKWGDGEAAVKLAQMIAKREGIGKLLGEGPAIAAKEIGRGAEEFALHVKGMGIPSHDPRVYIGSGLEYAVSNRGACHLQGFSETYESIEYFFAPAMEAQLHEQKGIGLEDWRFWGLPWGKQHDPEKKGKTVYLSMAAHNAFDSIILCKFMPYCDMTSGKEIVNMLNAIMGTDLTRDSLTEIGERLIALKRAFNMRCGLTKADDRLPKRLTTPAPDGEGKHGSVPLDVLMKDFYEAAGWDWNTGKPTRERLVALGLNEAAKDLWG
ncbi:MAG: aldehyde ferredoxin oxidoreductase family protein [Candidatus Abyssubacteria bacterium]